MIDINCTLLLALELNSQRTIIPTLNYYPATFVALKKSSDRLKLGQQEANYFDFFFFSCEHW